MSLNYILFNLFKRKKHSKFSSSIIRVIFPNYFIISLINKMCFFLLNNIFQKWHSYDFSRKKRKTFSTEKHKNVQHNNTNLKIEQRSFLFTQKAEYFTSEFITKKLLNNLFINSITTPFTAFYKQIYYRNKALFYHFIYQIIIIIIILLLIYNHL